MPWYRMPFHQGGTGEVFHLHLGSAGNKKAPPPCVCCGWISARECDWQVSPGTTCDAPICKHCTTSPAHEKDICPAHVGPMKAWMAGRTNTVDGNG